MIHSATSAPVTDIPQRTLLTLLVIGVIALAFFAMRKGWQNKSKRKVDQISTAIPNGAVAISTSVDARFAGSTTSGNWLDRITDQNLGTPRGISLQVFQEGLFMTDLGDFNLWISIESIKKIKTGQGIAGDVVEKNGMLLITWQLGDLAIDTGVRVNRHLDHELIVSAVQNFPGKLQSAEVGA